MFFNAIAIILRGVKMDFFNRFESRLIFLRSIRFQFVAKYVFLFIGKSYTFFSVFFFFFLPFSVIEEAMVT